MTEWRTDLDACFQAQAYRSETWQFRPDDQFRSRAREGAMLDDALLTLTGLPGEPDELSLPPVNRPAGGLGTAGVGLLVHDGEARRRWWIKAPFGASPSGRQGIDHVTTIADAVFGIEELGFRRTAKRVAELDGLCRKEPDEPAAVDLETLKRLVRTMQANPAWGEPALTLSDEGYAHAEWKTEGGGRVSMTFLPRKRVDYAAISAPATTPEDILNVGGHHIEEEAIIGLRWFTNRIVAR